MPAPFFGAARLIRVSVSDCILRQVALAADACTLCWCCLHDQGSCHSLHFAAGCLSSRCLHPFLGAARLIRILVSDCILRQVALAANAIERTPAPFAGAACMIEVLVTDCILRQVALAADACTLFWCGSLDSYFSLRLHFAAGCLSSRCLRPFLVLPA
jgi:hypothetical protein